MKRAEDAPKAFQAAWNAHDMEAFGALFHKNARFVNRFGHYVRGVTEIVRMHRAIHETIYRDSTLRTEMIDALPVGEGAMILHFWGHLSIGFAHPAGPHDIDTLIQAVLTKQEEEWRIQAAENVTLTDPRTGNILLRS